MHPEKLEYLQAFALQQLIFSPIFFMHPEKLKIFISFFFAVQYADRFSIFLYPQKLESYILMLVLCNTLIIFPIIFIFLEKLKIYNIF